METYFLALLAELHCLANQPALGLSVIDEGGSLADAKAPPGPIRPSGASISISGPKPLDRVTRRARVHPASSFFILHSLYFYWGEVVGHTAPWFRLVTGPRPL